MWPKVRKFRGISWMEAETVLVCDLEKDVVCPLVSSCSVMSKQQDQTRIKQVSGIHTWFENQQGQKIMKGDHEGKTIKLGHKI
jgi:hypothetical protein